MLDIRNSPTRKAADAVQDGAFAKFRLVAAGAVSRQNRGLPRWRLDRPEGQDEAGAAAGPVLDAHVAAVQLDNPPDEREPNSDPAAAKGIGPPKPGEYRLFVPIGNSWPL